MWSSRVALPTAMLAVLTTAVIADHPVAKLGDPLPGLTADEMAKFDEGKDTFQEVEGNDKGLGPVFNEASCATCHSTATADGLATGGSNGRLETRFGRVTSGTFDPLASEGGSLLQDHGIGLVAGGYTYAAETIPADANVAARRRTTPLFGLGLVDAVPDSTFKALAQLERLLSPSTAGTLIMVPDLTTGKEAVGKFGWKDQNPNLLQFSGDAYLNEMGVTSTMFPNENCPQGDCTSLVHNPFPGINDTDGDVQKFADYMSMLAPPSRGTITRAAQRGEFVFLAIGCANCHTPALITGPSNLSAANKVVFHPYSDFLLHDMGSLGDGIVQGPAGATMMRTAPLWGLRFNATYLHDGRATDVQSAILAHEGQGQASRNKFATLSSQQQADLLAFLSSL